MTVEDHELDPAPGNNQRSAPERDRMQIRLVLYFLAALAIFDQLRQIRSVTRKITTGDETTMWYAAREWGALRPHQLNYYGQKYGSSLEGAPLEILRRVGPVGFGRRL